MAVSRQRGIFYLLVLIIFCSRFSRQFVQKTQLACHSSGTCGSAQLSCNADQRLAILNVRHAHHANVTQFDVCPVEVSNCSQVQEFCCLPGNVSDKDCLESYEQTTLLDVHRNCSGAADDSGGKSTCSVQLPPLPSMSSGLCAKTGKHQSASSYSYVDYACIIDSDISTQCAVSEKTGSLLYVMWTPADAQRLENNWTNATCICRVTSPTSSSAEVFVRTLDLRLPKPGVAVGCSSVSVVDTRKSQFQTPCGDSSVFLFDPIFQQNNRIGAVTPFDITLSLHVNHVPEMVWIGFQSTNSAGDLKLTCYAANQEIVALGAKANGYSAQTEDDSSDLNPNVGAIVGGSLGGAVVIVVLGFICLYCYTKRKTKNITEEASSTRTTSTKISKKRDSWWEKTRQEDRIAELSQLGPASAVIIDDRRHMGYGKHRPTRHRYRYNTSEENPPIFVVPGSAVVQTPGVQIVELVDDDDGANSGEVATGAGVFWDNTSSVDQSGDVSGGYQGDAISAPEMNITGSVLDANPLDHTTTGTVNSPVGSLHKKASAPSNAIANIRFAGVPLDVTSSQVYDNVPASGVAAKGPLSTVLTAQKPQNPKDKEAERREALEAIQRARQNLGRDEGREATVAVTVNREDDEPTVSYSRFVNEGGKGSQK